MPGVTIGVENKVTITRSTGRCTCGWITTQSNTDRAILVSEWHLKSHTTQRGK